MVAAARESARLIGATIRRELDPTEELLESAAQGFAATVLQARRVIIDPDATDVLDDQHGRVPFAPAQRLGAVGPEQVAGQVPVGDPLWHVAGSADGRWAAADDFQDRLWLIDRHNGEMPLLSDNGHVRTASDHQHPTFNADGTEIEIQSALLSADHRSLTICLVPVPPSGLARTCPA